MSVEDLVVDGETYGCVKSFCYLGQTLDGDSGADLAATAKIRSLDIQSHTPTRDKRSSVCQLCQKQYGLWK